MVLILRKNMKFEKLLPLSWRKKLSLELAFRAPSIRHFGVYPAKAKVENNSCLVS